MSCINPSRNEVFKNKKTIVSMCPVVTARMSLPDTCLGRNNICYCKQKYYYGKRRSRHEKTNNRFFR